MIGYATVHFGKSLLWIGEDALTLFVMVRFLGLPPAIAGLVFMASAFWNALCDGVFGTLLGRVPVIVRLLPTISLVALLVAGTGFALLPMVPQGSLTVAGGLLFLFRLGFSLADVPHNALTRGLAERYGHLALARVRSIGSGVAALVIGIVGFAVLSAGAGATRMVEQLVLAIGLAAIVMMLPLPMLLAHDRVGVAEVRSSGAAGAGHPADFDRMLWLLCAASAIGLTGMAALGKAILHLDFRLAGIGAAALLLLTLGRLAAIWLWSPLARVVGNRPALALSYVAAGLSALTIPWLAGAQGSGLVLMLCLAGLSGGGASFLSWAVLSETLGTQGRAGGRGNYAAGFGYFTMSMKIGLGVSGALTGIWLAEDGAPFRTDPAAFWPLSWVALSCALIAAAMTCVPASANAIGRLRKVA